MTDPKRRSSIPVLRVIGAAFVIVALITAGAMLVAGRRALALFESRTTVTHAAVVQRLQAVARLVTTEATVRDVVTYQNTWLGSTKRSLVIVTGKAMVGIDLQPPPPITIDERARRIAIVLPRARLLGVDITELRTYDERRGIWNPFRPADRDTIYLLARRQLESAAAELEVLAHADESARRFAEGLFAAEGYTVSVTLAGDREN